MKTKKIFEILNKNPYFREVYSISKVLNLKIYIVGGVIRDIFRGETFFTDFDFVVIGKPEKLVKELSKKWGIGYKKFPFNTYEFELNEIEMDFAMARKENYRYPGALPEVYPTHSIEEDLKRRDFTINAIALKLFNSIEIIDPFNGVKDIELKKIRVIRKDSFKEDPTRALRALKYSVKLGFEIDIESTEFEMARRFFKNVSIPRFLKELREIAKEKRRKEMIEKVLKYNFFSCYFGEDIIEKEGKILFFMEVFNRFFPDFKKGDFVFMLAIVLKEPYNEVKKHLSSKERKLFEDSFKKQNYARFNCNMEPRSFLISLLKSGIEYHKIKTIFENFRNLNMWLKGDYLIKMGFKGKIIGRILDALKNEKIMGEVNEKFDEIKFLENYFLNRK